MTRHAWWVLAGLFYRAAFWCMGRLPEGQPDPTRDDRMRQSIMHAVELERGYREAFAESQRLGTARRNHDHRGEVT